MSLINPFNKKGREETSFVDRTAIAILWLFVMIMTILLPILIYKWYEGTSPRHRTIFWIVVGVLAICGLFIDEMGHIGPSYLK